MVEILCKDSRSLTDAGNSQRVSIPADWLEMLGFDEVEEVKVAVLHSKKHGLFLGAWKEGNQPDLENLPEEQTRKLSDGDN